MGKRNGNGGTGPEFDVALWGYDRQQVQRCLGDLTARLEQALSQLDSVEVLQEQLCEAHLEIGRLQRAVEEDPPLADQLSKIMMTAEQLRDEAAQDAEEIRARAYE